MKFFRISAAIMLIFVSACAGEHPDVEAAKTYIQSQSAQRKNTIDLRKFPNIDQVPEEVRQVEGLKRVILTKTNVADLSSLSGIQSLEHIAAHGTKISDLRPIANLPNLKHLQIGETPVRDLEPLTNIRSLERLDIGTTHTLSLEPITRLPKLNWLNLHNAMSDDGSKTHFEALKSRGSAIEVFGGTRFEQNYIPR
jgi:Leucine-rich repeat (LRR) protein